MQRYPCSTSCFQMSFERIFIKIYESGGSVFVPAKNETQTSRPAKQKEVKAVDMDNSHDSVTLKMQILVNQFQCGCVDF